MTAREKKQQANKKYRDSEKGKTKQSESYKRYRKTPKGREAHKRNR